MKGSRTTLWLAVTATVLVGVVATLAVLLLRQGTPAAARAPLAAAVASAATAAPPRPYVNLLDPKAPPAAPAPAKPAPPASPDPLSQVMRGLGKLFDDPSLKKLMDDLQKDLQKSVGQLGRLWQGLVPRGPGNAPDPFGGALDQLFDALGGGPRDDRIVARVQDQGGHYLVRCRFPRGAPENASFEIRGEELLVTARFPGGEKAEKRIELPGPGHPLGAKSELVGGELLVTVPKAR